MEFLTQIRAKTNPIVQATLNLVFPPRCVSCEAETEAAHTLCHPCFAQLQLIGEPHCESCGLPFEFDLGQGARCSFCLHDAPRYYQARTAMQYDAQSRRLITRLKYGDRADLVPALVQHMWRAGAALCEQSDWLIPVPLHSRRLRQRGFNQSSLLAHGLSRHARVAVMADGLLRVLNTPPQASLSRVERLQNVRRAFRVNHKRALLLKRQRVLLIDDVMTTGATVDACTEALLAAGVACVNVLTVARTVREV